MIVEAIAATTERTLAGHPPRRYVRGAFAKATRPDRGRGIPVLIDHDPKRHVGVVLGLWEVETSLTCRIRLEGSLGEHLGFDLRDDPDDWGLSIHPRYTAKHIREVGGVRIVASVPRLEEISFCRKWCDWSRAPRNMQTRILRVA